MLAVTSRATSTPSTRRSRMWPPAVRSSVMKCRWLPGTFIPAANCGVQNPTMVPEAFTNSKTVWSETASARSG